MNLRTGLFSVIMFVFLQANAQKVTNNFIAKFSVLAQDLKAEWGVPASIILGVSILESGSGTSLNARQLNNYFGITGKNSLKHRRTMYKQFVTPAASFEGFCKMLSGKKFYKGLKNNMDYSAWLAAMNKANYAGAKGVWVSRVKSVIQKHHLYKYDK